MRAYLSAYVAGAMAALSVPLWLRGEGSRLAELVKGSAPFDRMSGDPAVALRAAHAALRVLARARLPWWRNTCLFRAVAECLVLRRYGIPCRVELGVTRADGDKIGAHAWVVCGENGARLPLTSMTVLR